MTLHWELGVVFTIYLNVSWLYLSWLSLVLLAPPSSSSRQASLRVRSDSFQRCGSNCEEKSMQIGCVQKLLQDSMMSENSSRDIAG